MTVPRAPFVQESVLRLDVGADPAAPGGAVTVALCGSWLHDGPCPLAPHHNEVRDSGEVTVLRTVFVVDPDREAEVRSRIRAALAAGRVGAETPAWSLVSSDAAALGAGETISPVGSPRPPPG